MTKVDLLNLAADYKRIAWWIYHKENSLVLAFLKRIKIDLKNFKDSDKTLNEMVFSPLKRKINFDNDKSMMESSEEFLTASVRLQRYLGY